MSLKSLINQIQVYNPDAEVELLERCYRFAEMRIRVKCASLGKTILRIASKLLRY